jgi:ubiquinone/menaquinone biosynthesis C-methylase UbiE
VEDSWTSGDPYDYYMGRWSRLAADSFLRWIARTSGLNWLDVGCGSGALSEAIAAHQNPAKIIAIDQSEGFVRATQRRLGQAAQCRIGNALSLPLPNASVDATVSGLVLNFIPETGRALEEMYRVTNGGGIVAAYVWDYPGQMELLRHFWDAAVEINPEAASLHESKRFPDCNPDALSDRFQSAGLTEVETAPIDINTRFADFNDYWHPFLGGQGPAPTFVQSLSEADKGRLQDSLRDRLVTDGDGAINLIARAWAAKGFKKA